MALLEARQQAALALAQAGTARRIAHRQAAMGVPVDRAADHGVRAPNALYGYWIGVVVPTCITGLCTFAHNPFIAACGAATVVLAVLLYPRVRRYVATRADWAIVYSVPTWVVVAAWIVGALAVPVIGLVDLWCSV